MLLRSFRSVRFCSIVPGCISISDVERSIFMDTFSGTSSLHLYVLRFIPTFLGSLRMPHPRCGHIFLSGATAFDSSQAAIASSSWAPRSSRPTMSLVPESFFESFFHVSGSCHLSCLCAVLVSACLSGLELPCLGA